MNERDKTNRNINFMLFIFIVKGKSFHLKNIFRKFLSFKTFLMSLSYLPNPSTRAGYDTRSIFKRSLTGLNSEFSFS